MDPTIKHILESKDLRWLFCGGKGGVGKTSNSCAIALELAKVRDSVLIISTDPAHNLSDAFGQKFGKEPRAVEGVPNLHAMEIDPSGTIDEFLRSEQARGSEVPDFLSDIALSIPGIDEALSFAEVMKRIQKRDYSIVVFDTAPTGHTLRFLQFPTILETLLGKFKDLSAKFGPMLNSFLGPQGKNIDEMLGKLDETRAVVSEANKQFKNPDLTTFVCVCIAEFLSLYETERMIQELDSYEIDVNTIIVNQLLYPPKGSNCQQCTARTKMQHKYLEQFHELYEDFHIIELPQLTDEIRGLKGLQEFSEMLVKPYVPK